MERKFKAINVVEKEDVIEGTLGLKIVIKFNPNLGIRLGYLKIPKINYYLPFLNTIHDVAKREGKEVYDVLNEFLNKLYETSSYYEGELHVHGDYTFSGYLEKEDKFWDNEDKKAYYTIGFDCGHLDDLQDFEASEKYLKLLNPKEKWSFIEEYISFIKESYESANSVKENATLKDETFVERELLKAASLVAQLNELLKEDALKRVEEAKLMKDINNPRFRRPFLELYVTSKTKKDQDEVIGILQKLQPEIGLN